MGLQRAQICLPILVGLVLSWILHSCQPQQLNTLGSETTPLSSALKAVGEEKIYIPPKGDVRLVAISDLNGAYGATDYDPEVDKAIALLPVWQPDMVVCGGDMIAGQKSTLSEKQLQAMWSAFDAHIAAPLRQQNIPYGFTMGNHDGSNAKNSSGKLLFQQERYIAANYWNDSKHHPGLEFVDRYEFPFYYSFKFNDIFFLAWDGSYAEIPPDKLAWVEKTLASPEAQSAKMRIVLGHLPLYAVAISKNRPGEVMNNADRLRKMLEKYQVHTYISGHHHVYYPAHKGELQLLHTGLLGSGPRQLIDSKLPPQKSLTVIDINFADPNLTTYTTYDINTLELIETEQLPRFVTGHNGIVLRRDIEAEELTNGERAICASRLNVELCGGQ